MMRNLCLLLAATALAGGLAGCSNNDTHTTDTDVPTPSGTPQQTVAPAPTAS